MNTCLLSRCLSALLDPAIPVALRSAMLSRLTLVAPSRRRPLRPLLPLADRRPRPSAAPPARAILAALQFVIFSRLILAAPSRPPPPLPPLQPLLVRPPPRSDALLDPVTLDARLSAMSSLLTLVAPKPPPRLPLVARLPPLSGALLDLVILVALPSAMKARLTRVALLQSFL